MPAVEEGTPIYCNRIGYFSRFVDHCEEEFSPQLLETLDGDTVQQMLEQEYPYDTQAFGKCVNSYQWYYVTVIPLEDAEMFQEGADLTITFVGSTEDPVSGWDGAGQGGEGKKPGSADYWKHRCQWGYGFPPYRFSKTGLFRL